MSEVELLRAENLKLVAENVALKAAVPALKEVSYENDSFDDVSIAEQIGFNEAVRMTTNNMQSTPNTDAAIADIKAMGIEIYKAKCLQSIERTKLTLKPEQRELAEQMLLGIIDGCDVVAKELRDGTLPEKFTTALDAGGKG